jgi:hypothetical protein
MTTALCVLLVSNRVVPIRFEDVRSLGEERRQRLDLQALKLRKTEMIAAPQAAMDR